MKLSDVIESLQKMYGGNGNGDVDITRLQSHIKRYLKDPESLDWSISSSDENFFVLTAKKLRHSRAICKLLVNVSRAKRLDDRTTNSMKPFIGVSVYSLPTMDKENKTRKGQYHRKSGF
ncbi:MAG TPA: hypothetical protein VMX18_04040 [Candidatus Bipolaricaulota bacterium]|nr:hypothetical protein [Candidatus Bipolaricaulota bacterium]